MHTLLIVATAIVPSAAADEPLLEHPAGILATLLAVLALIFWLTQHPTYGRIFKVVPALVFCYFIPTALTTAGILPPESALYSWIKAYVLPAALLLLILSLDLPGIIRLGPKALIMLLTGTVSIVIGGPIALWLCQGILPADAWQGMTALAGSWIGGGANFVALGDIAGASSTMMAMMVVPDVLVASIWMGVLLYLSGKQHEVDRWSGANTQAIRDLEQRLTDYQQRTSRVASMPDLMIIFALGFGASWISYAAGRELFAATQGEVRQVATGLAEGLESADEMTPLQLTYVIDAALQDNPAALESLPTWRMARYHICRFLSVSIGDSTWKYILVTMIGVLLSFTPARRLEGAGASKIGSVLLYLLVACIGASADFREIVRHPEYFVMGFVWMSVHVPLMLGVGYLIRAPIFFVAVGSQSNIGGAASAPVVAAAYHPSLAPVGALLAVLGYVLGTYAGLVCMHMLKQVAGAA